MSLLQDLRHQAGWTQQDVADNAEVDIRTVKRWESEEEPPERLVKLYQELFGDSVDTTEPSETQILSLGNVMSIEPDPLQLSGKLAPLLGSLPRSEQFTILLGGASGAGKSTAAMIIASDLAEHGMVLIATSEERLRSGTIGIRAKQSGINPDSIDVAEVRCFEDLEAIIDEGGYAFVVIDSINELDINPDDLSRLLELHSDTSFILVAQADASEKRTVGGARWRHFVDIRLWCERNDDGQRVIKNLKNRFGPSVDSITLDHTAPRLKTVARLQQERKQMIHEESEVDNMDTTYRWLIDKLEAELASVRQELLSLRTQLTEKETQLREVTVELARLEASQEAIAESGKKTLSDTINAENMALIADRFAPLIGAVTSAFLNKGQKPERPSPNPYATPYPEEPPSFTTAQQRHPQNDFDFLNSVSNGSSTTNQGDKL